MLRKLLKVTVAGLLGLGVVLACYSSTTQAADADADISTIMKKTFGKAGIYKSGIPSAVKGGKWDEAKKLAIEGTEYGAALGKNKPPKGEAKSWETQCTKFAGYTKDVLKAVEAKDEKATAASLKTIGTSCGACHKPHKP